MLQVTSMTVSSGNDITTICDLGSNQVVAFIFPSTMTSTGANLTASVDGVNFYNVINTQNEVVSLSNPAGGYTYLSPEISYAIPRFIQLVLDDSEAADRTIQVLTREV